MRRSLLSTMLLLAGCSTLPASDAYVRDGQAFGVTDGTFRGRWWNHYERGRSFLDGGFYAEAEADLRIALSLRAEDQRWARTYGLHFIPEYFPNRELGIVLYHQGQLDEAANRLETSLAQEQSALAAHYLNQARLEAIDAAGGDSEAPAITATYTEDPAPTLLVTVSDNTFVAQVDVEGEPHPLQLAASKVSFSRPVSMVAGKRTISVQAIDLSGNSSQTSVSVDFDLDGPAVAFTDDESNAGQIAGYLSDPSGIAGISFDGMDATLAPMTDGTIQFRANLPAADATSLHFVATDLLGNATEGRVRGPGRERNAELARSLRFASADDSFWLTEIMRDVILAQSPATPAEASIHFANLADGQRYLMEEIMVSVEARDPDGIATLLLNGTPMEVAPQGVTNQHLSRRVRLPEVGTHQVAIAMTDTLGNRTESVVTVHRDPTAIELPDAQLRVAMLGNLWEGAGPRLEDEAAFIAEELSRAIFDRKRFDLVSRDALPRVLDEQELRTVLGSRDMDAGLRQLLPADVFAVGKARRTGDSMEIVLQAVSTETSSILAYADVAGRAENLDDLRQLARDLALRFEQEFPKVSGEVLQLSGTDQCFSSLAEADRVRKELPCVVYRFGEPILDPETGAVLGRPTDVIARGKLTEVREQLSRITLDNKTSGVQVNDHVATR